MKILCNAKRFYANANIKKWDWLIKYFAKMLNNFTIDRNFRWFNQKHISRILHIKAFDIIWFYNRQSQMIQTVNEPYNWNRRPNQTKPIIIIISFIYDVDDVMYLIDKLLFVHYVKWNYLHSYSYNSKPVKLSYNKFESKQLIQLRTFI